MARNSTDRRVRAVWACLLFLSLAFPVVLPAAEPASTNQPAVAEAADARSVLAALEKKISNVKTVQAAFVQEKRLAILDRTVTLEGRLTLENPGRLAWHVKKPVRYAMVIESDVLRQWDEDTKQVQKLALTGNPVFKVVVEQLQSWFAGRYSQLTREYDVSVVSRSPATRLRFIPRSDAPAAKAVKAVTVTFREDERYVSEILIEDLGGDTTKMTFSETVLNEPIPAGAWEVEPRD